MMGGDTPLIPPEEGASSSPPPPPPPPPLNDAPSCTRSMRVLDPCNFPFSLGSYKQRSPGGNVVNPAPAFLIRSLSSDDCRCVDGPRWCDARDDHDVPGDDNDKAGKNALPVIAPRASAATVKMTMK
jgi:hypothetical protein